MSTVDQLIADRNNVINALYANPSRFAGTLYTKKQVGSFFNRKLIIYSPYLNIDNINLCCLTQDIERELPQFCLLSGFKNLPENPDLYVITARDNPGQGQLYYLKVTDLPDIRIGYSKSPPTSRHIQNVPQCLYHNINDLRYISSDTFTNDVLIGFVLSSFYTNDQINVSGLNGILSYYGATICGRDSKKQGVRLIEYANEGSLIDFIKSTQVGITKDVVRNGVNHSVSVINPIFLFDILRQILTNLAFLQKNAEFNHGDLYIKNIFILSDEHGFYAKIGNFERASLSIANRKELVRLFNSTTTADAYLYISPFKPNIGKTRLDELYYKLDTITDATSFALIRNMGIPFYKTFDIYTLIVSLFMVPGVFNLLDNDEQVYRSIWEKLWFVDDLSEAYSRIYRFIMSGKQQTYADVVDVLRGLKLRCGIMDYLV